MGRVRVFYGHEGVVPPTGFRPRSAAAPAPEVGPEVDEIVSDDLNGEPVELVGEAVEGGGGEPLAPASVEYADGREVEVGEDGIPVLEPIADESVPDESWTKADLLAYAEEVGIDMTGATKTKPAALARVLEYLKEK